jgi:hypothetical protein
MANAENNSIIELICQLEPSQSLEQERPSGLGHDKDFARCDVLPTCSTCKLKQDICKAMMWHTGEIETSLDIPEKEPFPREFV